MRWEGISEFVCVAEYESFTRAARTLGISTAQVSRQISALEERLNIKLLYRTTRKVSLTEEGRVFYQHCRSVLDGLDAAEQAVSNLQSKPQGRIKLTAPVTYGEQQLLPLINDFMMQYRDIEVTAFLSNQQIDLIEGGYDLAIRIGKLRDSTMMAKKLSLRTNFVCATPAYLHQYGMVCRARLMISASTTAYWVRATIGILSKKAQKKTCASLVPYSITAVTA